MKNLRTYYVVDPIMESIVGSFEAPSEDAAKTVFKKGILDNEKMKSYGDTLVVYCEPLMHEVAETYSEIVDVCGKVDLYEGRI